MDKGLDIAERRCVLAFYAAAPDSRQKLATFSREFVHARTRGATIRSTARTLAAKASELGCALQWAAADASLAWAEQPGRSIITIFDPGYPSLLAEISAPPIVLFVRGDAGILGYPQVAIVGARKATHYGSETAFRMAQAISDAGFTVTSGMASGIDAAAHRGALVHNGTTVAIYGCGIDRVYPARHAELAEKIAAQGVLVSEFPLASAPRPYHFPRRNRIISGLSYGTLVVEAALKSGSLSTAMHSLEQGREVFAVPGSIHNPVAGGCHQLIKQGATLVETPDDVLAQLPLVAKTPTANVRSSVAPVARSAATPTREERSVLEACAFEATTYDEIVQRSGLTPTQVSSILSALEVGGLVRSLAGNTYLNIVS